jgi:predicted Zn-dependent protease
MAAKGGSSTPAILSSHPSDATRISNIQKALPEIRAKYASKK